MKNECSIVRDLLPLYTDHMTSDETDAFIEEHLEHCEECRNELKKLQEELPVPQETEPVMSLAKTYKKKKTETILCTAALAVSLLLSLFAWLTKPQYLLYKQAVESVTETDTSVMISFSQDVTYYDTEYYTDPDTGKVYVDVSCWTTDLDKLWGRKTAYRAVLAKTDIWYKANQVKSVPKGFTIDDAKDVHIYGDSDMHFITLRRLTLNYYLIMSMILSLAFGIIYLITKKKILLQIFLVPFSWLCANLIVEHGFGSATFSLIRDFILICFLSVSLYVSFLMLSFRIQETKSIPE